MNGLAPRIDERNSALTISFRTPFFGFIDSKGHSRFVLRILIILSHPEPQTRAGRIAVHVHVVGTVIAHIAKTAMYAPPGIGSSRPPCLLFGSWTSSGGLYRPSPPPNSD